MLSTGVELTTLNDTEALNGRYFALLHWMC